MAENQPPADAQTPFDSIGEPHPPGEQAQQQQQQQPPVVKKKKRWWLRIILVLLVLIVLLVALAPYIASTGPVRSIVVSQVNNNLNGSVEIADYSVGWTGGISASGVKVYDAQKNLVLEVPRLVTKLSLIGAIRGDLNLGDTQIDVKLNDVRLDKDGKLNLAGLAKSEPKVEKQPGAEHTKTTGLIDIPNVKGKLTVNLLGGQISGEGVPAPVTVEPGSVALDFPDINKPIQNAVKLAYRVGAAATSEIALAGTVDVGIQNNKLDLDKLTDNLKADQKLDLNNVDLAAAEPVLGPDMQVGGIAAGGLAINAVGITGISANGKITVANAKFASKGLPDVVQVKDISIPIEVTRTVLDANTTVIDIKTLKVVTPLSVVEVTGQFQEQMLDRLKENKAPGADGTLVIAHSIPDMGQVARALPNTLKLAKGVEVDSGTLTDTATITFATDRITLAQSTHVSAKGSQNGRPIELKPVDLVIGAVALPNGQPIPKVQDIKLALTSDFARITGGGESIAKVDVRGDFDLAKLRNEVAQFSDLGDLQLAGTGSFAITNTGDVTRNDQPIEATVTANLNNVKVSGIGPATKDKPIEQERLALVAGAKILRDAATGAVSRVAESSVTLQTGDTNAPLVDVAAVASNVDLKPVKVESFKVSKLNVTDLAAAYKQAEPFLSKELREKNLRVTSGALYVSLGGSYAEGAGGASRTVELTQPLAFSLGNLGLTKDGRAVLDKETIRGGIEGKFALDGNNIAALLNALSVESSSNLFSVNKTGDAPVDVKLVGAGVAGNGVLNIAADLKRLNDIAQAFGGTVKGTNEAGQVKSGKFDGTLKIAHVAEPFTDVNFDGTIANLTVTTNDKPLQNETVKITLAARSPDDFSGLNVSQVNVASKFATANVTDTKVNLKGGVWELLQGTQVNVQVPDIPALIALQKAFAPPPAPVAPGAVSQAEADPTRPLMMQAAPDNRRNRNRNRPAGPEPAADAPAAAADDTAAAAAPPPPPIEVGKGSASVKLTVKRDAQQQTTTLDVSEVKVSDLTLRRGQKRYGFKSDVNLKLNASVKAAQVAGKTVAQQLQSVEVTVLEGDLGGIARLSMPQKITLTNLADMSNLVASGQIKIDGALADEESHLLSFLQGAAAPPVRTDGYSVVQTISTKAGGAISLVGSVIANNLKVLDEQGKVAFTEPQLSIKNDVDANMASQTANVRTLSVEMPQSQAVSLNLAARVRDWNQNCVITDADGNGPAKVELSYDLAKIWPIVHPMMVKPGQEDSFKDLKIAGKYNKTFTLSGKYPVKKPFNQAVRTLEVAGGVSVGLLDWTGLNIQELSPNVTVKDGIARVDGGGVCNEGRINLAGITLDLTKPTPLVSVPNDTHMLKDVHLNPVLVNSLGKFASVIFGNAEKAEGKLNVVVKRYEKVPLGALVNKSNRAQAEIVYSVDELHLDGSVVRLISRWVQLSKDGIHGSIPDSTVKLANGQIDSDMTILIGKDVKDRQTGERSMQGQPLRFTGAIGLQKLDLRNYKVDIPPGLLPKEFLKAVPKGLIIPVTGTVNDPNIDGEKAIEENLKKNLIPGLIGGGDDKNKNQGDGKDGGNPIDDIIKGLGKKKKK